MSEHELSENELGPDTIDQDALGDAPQLMGTNVESFLAPRLLVPSIDWVNKHVTARGKGTKVFVARIYGYATRAEAQQNEWQGKTLNSVCIFGNFEATNFLTGEITGAPALYLPMGYAKQVQDALLQDDVDRVLMHVVLGCEATGKPIPYRWTITNFADTAMTKELARLRRAVPRQIEAALRRQADQGLIAAS